MLSIKNCTLKLLYIQLSIQIFFKQYAENKCNFCMQDAWHLLFHILPLAIHFPHTGWHTVQATDVCIEDMNK